MNGPSETIRRIFPAALLIAVAALCGNLPARGQASLPASAGTEFYTMLPSLGIADGAQLRLLITAAASTSVTVTFLDADTSVSQFVDAGQSWDLTIPRGRIEVIGQQETRSDRALRIASDEPVTVHAFHDVPYFTEAWVLLPVAALGADHRVMSFGSINDLNLNGGVAAAVATEDNTTLRITPTVTTASGNSPGFTYGVTLNRGEVWQVVPQRPERTDMSGTRLQGDKPIAVISGHRGTDIVPGIGATNPLVESIPPVHEWGREFYAVPPPGRDSGYYKFTAAENGTTVRVNGVEIATLNAGGSVRHQAPGAATITASGPILAASFGYFRQSDTTGMNADPSMTLLQPVNAWADSYLWTIPALDPRPWPEPTNPERFLPFTHFLLVTAAGSNDPVLLDGVDISARLTIPHPGGAFRSGIVQTEAGTHTLSSSIPVAAQLIGYNHYDGYFLPAGYRVPQPLEAAPVIGATCAERFDTTIVLRNMRGFPLRVEGATFVGLNGSVIDPPLPFDIPPFSERSVRVRVDLPGFGLNAGAVRFRPAGDSLPEAEALLRITRDSLAAMIAEGTVRFPDATQANPVRDTVVRLVNTGPKPIRVEGFALSPPFELLSPSFPAAVEPGDTLEIAVRFAPSGAGEFDRELRLGTSPCDLMPVVRLQGKRSDPALLEAEAADGPALLCPDENSGEVTIILRNRGGEPITLGGLTIEGDAADDYSAADDPSGTQILPGDSLELTILFVPRDTGTRRGTVRIAHDLPPGFTLVEIVSRKDSVGVAPDDVAIDFGPRLTCADPLKKFVRLRNTGTLPLRIDDLDTDGDPGFSTAGSIGREIAPGGTDSVEITFAPSDTGELSGTLLVRLAPCDTLLRIPLSGRGRRPSIIPLTDTIDFGDRPFCLTPDTLAARLLNNGTVADTIVSISVEGEGFRLGQAPDAILEEGEERSFSVIFAPEGIEENEEKEYAGRIRVRLQPCDLIAEISVKGRIRPIALERPVPDVDFGTLFPDTPAEAGTVIRNTGAFPVTIDSLDSGSIPEGMRLLSPPLPATVEPGETLELRFGYRNAAPATFTQSIPIFTSPCPAELSVIVRGEERPGSFILHLPDTAAYVDAVLDLPIRLLGAEELEEEIELTAEVRWDLRNLLPRAALSGEEGELTLLSDDILGEERVIRLGYRGTVPPDGLLGRLRLLVLLGNDDTTGLDGTVLEARLAATGGPLQGTARDGSFRTLGICPIDGDRFIEFGPALKLGPIRPNPTTGRAEADLNADGSGHLELTLYDMLGAKRRTLYSGPIERGRQAIMIDGTGLPPGAYLYELRSGAERAEGILLITK